MSFLIYSSTTNSNSYDEKQEHQAEDVYEIAQAGVVAFKRAAPATRSSSLIGAKDDG
jgi:hypothetical protein